MIGIFNSKLTAKLDSIFICDTAGQPMEKVSSILAIKDEGLQGDRYQNEKGYWDPIEGCPVTIITQHEISRANRKSPLSLDFGEHRRNMVISGIHPKKLINRTMQIGEAIFQYDKPRPPCGYLDQLLMKGTAKALANNSGCCVKVLKTGLLRVGDDVLILA